MKAAQIAAVVLAAAAGWCAARMSPARHADDVSKVRKILCYQSPMHPWVKSDKPGQCTVCGMDLVAIYEGGKGVESQAGDIVMLHEGSPNVLGLRTSEVRKQHLARTLRVLGMIGEDESRHGVISAPVEGRIDGLAMNHDGQPISRRQPIAKIFSRTLLAAANDYRLALEQGGTALEQATRRLEQCGLVTEQIQTIPQRQPDDIHFGIVAPLGGTVLKSYVSEGQYVKEGDKLFEIADFTRMWCMFTVHERDLPFVHERQIVTVRAASLPGEEFKARVGFISPNLDEATRSAHLRVVLENPEGRLKNRTSAEGTIELDAPEVLAVPRSAVLWPGGAPRVYVERAPGAYEQRKVKLGRAGDVLWEVLDGLKEGERVLLTGNMLIDGQAQLDRGMQDSGVEAKP